MTHSVNKELRLEILEASPPASSRTAEPYSLHEIDTHPDADRIWATILVLKGMDT
jgi:hypothetical protein